MTSEIKPIETLYNGYKFRSRLEARWAVFFDAAGIRYEYEPEGFKTKSGLRYLPDFYLPDENMYVEVKAPREEAWKELNKISSFIGNGIETLLILSNIPPANECAYLFPVAYYHPVAQGVFVHWVPFISIDWGEDDSVFVGINRFPLTPWLGVDEDFHRFSSKHTISELLTPRIGNANEDLARGSDNTLINEAYAKARQARFEFGEKG